ncbi:MAG: hypothetical protein CO129_08960, partial [Ignavibacteriales bacterium CG_4_9_14_3_um_filter_34_10]
FFQHRKSLTKEDSETSLSADRQVQNDNVVNFRQASLPTVNFWQASLPTVNFQQASFEYRMLNLEGRIIPVCKIFRKYL